MYYYAQGTSKDYTTAAKWYHMASEQGLAEAQAGLAWMYLNGYGVPRDDIEAYKLFLLAERNGYDVTGYKNDLEKKMTSDHITKANERAKAYLAKKELTNENK
jgi:TPR repeat protein